MDLSDGGVGTVCRHRTRDAARIRRGRRSLSSKVVALPRLDAVTSIVIPLLLSAVIVAACLHPVRRAARANPVDVLREQ